MQKNQLQKQDEGERYKLNPWLVLLVLMLGITVFNYMRTTQSTDSISYSAFRRDLAAGKISTVVVDGQFIHGKYVKPQNGKTQFATPFVDPAMAAILSKYNVEYKGAVHNTWFDILILWTLPALVFFFLLYPWLRGLTGGGGMGGILTTGRNGARISINKKTGVTFNDVAGIDEAKEELREIIAFLKNPKEYSRLGAHIPKGILLVGPPGTGKTLLAKAVAGEAGVPFFSISASEFIELFVGVGAARVRHLFEQATQNAPAIIFIDELDALGAARGAFSGVSGHDEQGQTLNQLLAEMDGFDTGQGVVILAATNRPEILDPALLRAGRFDRQVLVDNPDQKGRVQILRVHVKGITLDSAVALEQVAALTPGFSGADLANLVNEAALQATRRRSDAVTMEDFTRAMERIVAGIEKRSRVLTPFERKVIATHETGHALVALALPGTDVVHKVSIIPRGIGALGYTLRRPTEDRYIMTRAELEDKVCVLLGGKAAEKLVFNHISTGGADDMAKATDIARDMVARYGMDAKVGCVTYGETEATFLKAKMPRIFEKRYSEATAARIDEAVRALIDRAYTRAMDILRDNRNILDKCAAELLKTETLNEAQLKKLAAGIKKPPLSGAMMPSRTQAAERRIG